MFVQGAGYARLGAFVGSFSVSVSGTFDPLYQYQDSIHVACFFPADCEKPYVPKGC